MHRIVIEVDTSPEDFEVVSEAVINRLYEHMNEDTVKHKSLHVRRESNKWIVPNLENQGKG